MSSNPGNYMDYGGAGRPLNGRPVLRVAVWSQVHSPVAAGCSLRPIVCTPALSVTYSAAAAEVCGLWRYISVMPLPLPLSVLRTGHEVTGRLSVKFCPRWDRCRSRSAKTGCSLWRNGVLRCWT